MPTFPGRKVLSGLLAVCAAAFFFGLSSCSDSEETLLLDPGGNDPDVIETGDGAIEGVLTFDGVAGGTEATVYAVRAYDAGCATAFSTIHMTGTFTNWDTALWGTTPGMRSLGGCVWVDHVELPAARIEWKFVTNRAWDTPPDYAGTGSVQGMSGETLPGAGGSANLLVDVPSARPYYVFLSEATNPARYFILEESAAPVAEVDLTDGSFAVEKLGAGTYELIVVADGFIDFHVSGIVVGETAIDIGTRNVSSASGEIRGSVAFEGDPDPLPTATVEARTSAGATAATTETDAGGAYVLTGLADGTYDLVITAPGYLAATIEDVTFENGDFLTLDEVTLVEGCVSQFEIVEVLGEFVNWTPVGQMTQVEACVWEDTVTVVLTGPFPQRQFMKFRTGGSWDATPDFAHCGTEGDTLGLADAVCLGGGSAPALPVFFPATGNYRFRVDESALTYEITLLEEVEVGAVGGTVAFGDDPDPLPTATIEVFRAGTTDLVRTGSSGAGGAFEVGSVPVGIYDVAVSAFGYVDVTVEDVAVTAGATTALGTVTLAASEVCEPISEFVQVVGDFNAWDTGAAPMTRLGTCLFADTVQVTVTGSGQTHFMKFRTGNAWGTPPDYGTCLTEADTLFGGGAVCPAPNGPAIRMWFAETGDYEFRLNEEERTFTVTLVTSVALGTIEGRIAFSDAPDPLLRASVTLENASGGVVASTQSSATDGSFRFENLTAGTYAVEASRIGYDALRIADVAVAEGATVDLGTRTLTLQGVCVPLHPVVEILRGGVSEGPMTQVEPCVFADTIEVAAAGIVGLRFRTGGAGDDTPDYGPCTQGPALPLEGDVCMVTNESELQIQFTNAGSWIVTLDEFAQRYAITPVDVVLPGGLAGTVSWDDDPPTPPTTTVKVFVAGTNRVDGQTTVAAGAWSVDQLDPGAYDVEVSAPGYVTQKLLGIAVLEDQVTAVAPVTLVAIVDCTPSETVEIVGNWDGNPGEGLAPHMTNLEGCVWGDTLAIAASALPSQKLVWTFRLNETNGADTQKGECTNGVLVLESGGSVSAPFCRFLFTNSIEVQVPGDGNYAFTFDEQEETYTIRHLP